MKLGAKKDKYTSYAKDKKNKEKIKYISIVAGTAITVATVYQFFIMENYATKIELRTIAEITGESSGYAEAYKLKEDIDKGQSVTIDNLEKVTQNKSLIPTTSIINISELDGLVTRIPLSSNTVITKDMMIKLDEEITDSHKNQDYDWIKLHGFLQIGDYIDIHYKATDGSDTIVVSKRKVTNMSGSIMAIDITEKERMFINNATVKASLEGGVLYTSIYPDPENQNPATVTYVLDEAIEELIKNDPNVINNAADSIKNGDELRQQENETSNTTESGVGEVAEERVLVEKPIFIGGE